MKSISWACVCALLTLGAVTPASAVTLTNGSATFSQLNINTTHSPDVSVGEHPGIPGTVHGWAIARDFGNGALVTQSETAVWETTTDVDATLLAFTLGQSFGTAHTIRLFRLSYTTASRDEFADGEDGRPASVGGPNTPGDVGDDSIWTRLTGADFAGSTVGLTEQANGVLLANAAFSATYQIAFTGNFVGVTGIRLEVFDEVEIGLDLGLPGEGPGGASNGNFVLSSFALDASGIPTIPEPAALGLFVAAGAALRVARRRTTA